MAMFARRSLQRLLDELKETLSASACAKLAHELNRQNTSALGFEWELALLFSLSRVGSATYEAESNSEPSRPDCICRRMARSGLSRT
jgi:hypothetical protein